MVPTCPCQGEWCEWRQAVNAVNEMNSGTVSAREWDLHSLLFVHVVHGVHANHSFIHSHHSWGSESRSQTLWARRPPALSDAYFHARIFAEDPARVARGEGQRKLTPLSLVGGVEFLHFAKKLPLRHSKDRVNHRGPAIDGEGFPGTKLSDALGMKGPPIQIWNWN